MAVFQEDPTRGTTTTGTTVPPGDNPYAGGGFDQSQYAEAEEKDATGPQWWKYSRRGTYTASEHGRIYTGSPYERVPTSSEALDEYFERYYNIIGAMDPGKVKDLQRRLGGAGLLSSFADGVPDSATLSAFQELLGIANRMEVSWKTALDTVLSNTDVETLKERGYILDPKTGKPIPAEDIFQPPLKPPIQLPNRKDINRVVREATIRLLGQGWNDEQVNRVTDSYLAEVTRLQDEAYEQELERARLDFESGGADPNVAGMNIINVSAPTAETFAEEQIKEEDPEGYQVNTGMNLLMGLLDDWGGGISG